MNRPTRPLSLLGAYTSYTDIYSPSLLESLHRSTVRETLGIDTHTLPFSGFDLWTAYDLSWLNLKGKPVVAIGEFEISSSSRKMIESTSLELYLNSFNQTRFHTAQEVSDVIQRDLRQVAEGEVRVRLYPNLAGYEHPVSAMPGVSIDDIDISMNDYSYNPELLVDAVCTTSGVVSETLHSDLFKSNCLVTNQPGWGSIIIGYEGREISKAHLLRYLVSFRNHNEFHEHCVERIFQDIKKHCTPAALTVFARYTRRGGLDINPFRSDCETTPSVPRLIRQ